MEALLISYLGVLKQYVVFNGRARRREFWTFFLCNIAISVVLSILAQIPVLGIIFSIISGLFGLAILLPSLAVGARRLHDINKTGLLLLLCLVPIVGAIILIVFWAQDGTPGQNQYGPNPKGV